MTKPGLAWSLNPGFSLHQQTSTHVHRHVVPQRFRQGLKDCKATTPLAETHLHRFPLRRLLASRPTHKPTIPREITQTYKRFRGSARARNPGFKSDIGVNLDFPSDAEVKAEFASASKEVEEYVMRLLSGKRLLSTAIMNNVSRHPCSMIKTHKTVKNQALIQEVTIS
ncbi:hypothetical protein BKA70DRAFT_765050 [Coprinopsis sp. MPI-PUGE-AT-0042]|nr:hypothetical protein BKA70DRAFT_765050 [Coprinopsis sp. MPI-PUGE-AT-0042]